MGKELSIKNTADLREMLIETIEQVKSGTLEAPQARTIAALATTVLHSAKLDLDFLRFKAAHEDLGDASANVLNLVSSQRRERALESAGV